MNLKAGYELEELLPVVAWLTDRYTSKESSSVTYETAGMLMEAVVYCINECFEDAMDNMTAVSTYALPDARKMYDKGCKLLMDKVVRANKLYEELIESFEDYGCMNYHDTIIKGMPVFFVRYDIKFKPQDHILTMDYPALNTDLDLCGADLIDQYLEKILLEKQFMAYFSKNAITKLLGKLMPDYRRGFMDNMCEPVLLQAIGCMIAEDSISELCVTDSGRVEISRFFEGDDLGKAEVKIKKMIHLLTERMPNQQASDYFEKAARGLAVRILNSTSIFL